MGILFYDLGDHAVPTGRDAVFVSHSSVFRSQLSCIYRVISIAFDLLGALEELCEKFFSISQILFFCNSKMINLKVYCYNGRLPYLTTWGSCGKI